MKSIPRLERELRAAIQQLAADLQASNEKLAAGLKAMESLRAEKFPELPPATTVRIPLLDAHVGSLSVESYEHPLF